MKLLRPRSLQLRLAARLGAVFAIATVLVVGAFFYLSYQLAEELSRRDMFRLAEALARVLEADGELGSLDRLREWDVLKKESAFAIFDRNGHIITASSDAFRIIATGRSSDTSRQDTFRIASFGSAEKPYYGLEIPQESKMGSIVVMVAEPDNVKNELLRVIFEEAVPHAALILPIFIVITLLVGVFAIRSGLRPLRETATQAGTIKPDAISVRLSTENLPTEVFPLVNAVNRALDRLENGFALQREFTANAAHELRTPLAIITGALHEYSADSELAKLQQDVYRMNRLVQQLLNVARMDGIIVDVNNVVDIHASARDVVEYMAPLIFEQKRAVALIGTDRPVLVKGNGHAIEDALRNLLENAMLHARQNTEILVSVSDDGAICICNEGPTIPLENREKIFERFWRHSNSSGTGAGLGLAIVKETMAKHNGSVSVTDYANGGACFILQFELSA